MDTNIFMDASDICRRLKVGRSMAYHLLNSELRAVRIGRCLRVRESDFQNWLDRKSIEPSEYDNGDDADSHSITPDEGAGAGDAP